VAPGRHPGEVVHGSGTGTARVAVILTVPADRSFLPVLRLLVAGAVGSMTDAAVVEGVQRAVEDVAQALIRQTPSGTIETQLDHRAGTGPISIEMSVTVEGTEQLDEPSLLAVDRMLELVSLRSRRSIDDGVLRYAFSIRHVA
jgi:hypothetical protein